MRLAPHQGTNGLGREDKVGRKHGVQERVTVDWTRHDEAVFAVLFTSVVEEVAVVPVWSRQRVRHEHIRQSRTRRTDPRTPGRRWVLWTLEG